LVITLANVSVISAVHGDEVVREWTSGRVMLHAWGSQNFLQNFLKKTNGEMITILEEYGWVLTFLTADESFRILL
jgi:hypothetical protein